MDMEVLKPILAGMARHALTALGAVLVNDGVIQQGDITGFVGAGMVIVGVAWSWWQKRGQAQVAEGLKKLTATRTAKEAVTASQVLPPAAAVEKPMNAAAVKSVVGALLVAFALSAFLAIPDARAQARSRTPATLPNPFEQFNDKLKQDFTAKTGVKATGDVPFDLLRALDAKLLPDLQYALKLAQATGSKVTAPCYQAWIDMINTQQTAVQTKNADGTTSEMAIPDPHLVTDFERAVELRNALQPDSPFMTACSPVANMVKQDVVQFMAAVVAGGAGLATLVPGL